MGYNRENYRRIRAAYEVKYLKAYEEADRRRAALHAQCPELAEVDRKLAATAAEVALAAIGTGDACAENLAAVREKNLALQARRNELLASLGYPADYTDPPYECPACRDSGFVGTRMCDCMRRELIRAAYESSGLGELLRTQSFENFDLRYYQNPADRERMARNLEILREYAEHFEEHADSFLLYGPTGLGKTHLSTAVARRVIERGYDVYYASAIRMLSDFELARFGTSAGGGDATADLARYTGCDLLILDDLGTELTNAFTNSCLYMVLNERMNLRRPVIVNTNLTGKEIRERYADRITSRLLTVCRPLCFSGSDVRVQKVKGI